MSNLPKQLNILFFFVGVGILYGVYFLFIEPKMGITEEYKGKQNPELTAFMMDIDKKLGGGLHAEFYAALTKRAEDDWLTDPFYDATTYGGLTAVGKSFDKDYKVSKKDFVYTGFLGIGDKEVAIVNDMEYEAGEVIELEVGKYFLESIHPTKIVIGKEAGQKFLEIPIQEMEE